jgi:hypothetical protein
MAMDGRSKKSKLLPSQDDDSKYRALNLVFKLGISFTLNTSIELGIPDILAKGDATAEEILAQLPTKSNPPAQECLRKLECALKVLVREGIYQQSLNDEKKKVYGLTDLSKWFVKDNRKNVLPIAGLAINHKLSQHFVYTSRAILDEDVIPFVEKNGEPRYIRTLQRTQRITIFSVPLWIYLAR